MAKCEMAVMDHTGDSKTIWDSENEDEVSVARDTFNKLRKKGYAAFRVGSGGKKAEKMDEFDPEAGKMIMVPPLAGG